MKADTTSFIEEKYRPPGIIFQDPKNMHLNDIRSVLQHCYGLQVKDGPESAFRFSVFIGPQRKRLFAIYPNDLNTGDAELGQNRRKKNKGKQREDALQGLFRIEESDLDPTGNDSQIGQLPNPSGEGPSNNHSAVTDEPRNASPQNDLVRIDMGEMLQLKNMGYEAFGPVNGPNEGHPEYEVPQALMQLLPSHTQCHQLPIPNTIPFAIDEDETDLAPTPIDPALLGRDSEQIGHRNNEDSHAIHTVPEILRIPIQTKENGGESLQSPSNAGIGNPVVITNHPAGLNDCPTTPPIDNTDSADVAFANRTKTPRNTNQKRAQANLSPQALRRSQRTNKKKKMTDDDLAALEAQNILESGTRRRSKPTRRI